MDVYGTVRIWPPMLRVTPDVSLAVIAPLALLWTTMAIVYHIANAIVTPMETLIPLVMCFTMETAKNGICFLCVLLFINGELQMDREFELMNNEFNYSAS